MLAAIDNYGEIYFSIVQANVDHEVFCIFISKLVAKLTTEDANWKSKTIFVLDNASYHHDEMVLNQLKLQGCDVIFLGPYSFAAAPIELFFSALKRT